MIKSVITREGGDLSVQLFVDGNPIILNRNNFNRLEELLKAVMENDEAKILSMLPTKKAVKEFMKGKIEFDGNTIMYNGKKLFGALVDKILNIKESGESAERLILFLENLMSNPSEHARTQLYEFLERYHFPITSDGHFLAYKRLTSNYGSVHTGSGIVNGVPMNGSLPNNVGNILEIPRSQVEENPNVACASGLHCGSLSYVNAFGGNADPIVVVKVNPADVVSVPVDSTWQKIRTVRYEVVGEFIGEITADYYDVPKVSTPVSKVKTKKEKPNKEVKDILRYATDWAYGVITHYATDKSTVAKSKAELFDKFPASEDVQRFIKERIPSRDTGKVYRGDLVKAVASPEI